MFATVGGLRRPVQIFRRQPDITERESGADEAMTALVTMLFRIATDLKVAVLFSTRIPLGHAGPIDGADLARALWALPVAGVLVGSIGAIVYWAGIALGLSTFPTAALTVAATLLVTGALHEDGLADTADGFGGGTTRLRKLDIMRDSRIGTYGVCAVVMSLLLRTAALATMANPVRVGLALIAAHAAARAIVPAFMRVLPQARTDGLSADAGRPRPVSVAVALMIGAAALFGTLDPARATATLLLMILAFFVLIWLCRRQIGGQTGDTLGALEQVAELTALLCAAAG